jgi:hypothetical protein
MNAIHKAKRDAVADALSPLQRLRRKYVSGRRIQKDRLMDNFGALLSAHVLRGEVESTAREMDIEDSRVEIAVVMAGGGQGRTVAIDSMTPDGQVAVIQKLHALYEAKMIPVGLLIAVATKTEYQRWSDAFIAGPEAERILNLALYGQTQLEGGK